MRKDGVLVVGAGAAGHSAAISLRGEGFDRPVTVVHGERHPPHNRTLVNKAIVQGLLTPEQIALPKLGDLDVTVRSGVVSSLDRVRQRVVLADGHEIGYGALIVATGSAPRPPLPEPVEGPIHPEKQPLGRVLNLHTVDDALRVRGWLERAGQQGDLTVAVLGAGFVGSEAASWLSEVVGHVHLVSRPLIPLVPAVGQAIAERIADLHHRNVDTHFGRTIAGLNGDDRQITVRLDDGREITADLAIVAHGTAPGTAWLGGNDQSGASVDSRLRVVDLPLAYAAGSAALHRSAAGIEYRVDHWDAAVAQGAHAARALLHDEFGAPDPGVYVPSTGFNLNLYRTPISGYGVPFADHREETRQLAGSGGLVTSFISPNGMVSAGSSIHGARELLALRAQNYQ